MFFYFGRSGGAVIPNFVGPLSLRPAPEYCFTIYVSEPITPQQNKKHHVAVFFILVGVAGFEPATFCPPDKRATRLRYTPKTFCLNRFCADKNKLFGNLFKSNHFHSLHLSRSITDGITVILSTR